MLTNPIRGKAGRQILIPYTTVADTVLYVVPTNKYFELPFIPSGLKVTLNGLSITMTEFGVPGNSVVPAPLVLQAGAIISIQTGIAMAIIGTEYDA